MAPIPSIKINTGALIPVRGLSPTMATWSGPLGYHTRDFSRLRKMGFHCSQVYTGSLDDRVVTDTLTRPILRGTGTEPYVGAALRASALPREEVFVTTKLP
ncbi:hypothetical protein DFH06DRAFT_1188633 [Mycena polygramma]|nr:hypothetical protein DFH06DRAFT_1188633 [Mycena polygramma]